MEIRITVSDDLEYDEVATDPNAIDEDKRELFFVGLTEMAIAYGKAWGMCVDDLKP